MWRGFQLRELNKNNRYVYGSVPIIPYPNPSPHGACGMRLALKGTHDAFLLKESCVSVSVRLGQVETGCERRLVNGSDII
jgi:hypothetical protein